MKLNERELGEMLASVPPLRNREFASDVKRLRAQGCSLKRIALLTGKSVRYVQYYLAAFERAKRETIAPPLSIGQPRKWLKSYEKNGEGAKREGGKKKDNSLVVNFSSPLEGLAYTKERPRGVTYRPKRGWQAQIRIGKNVKYLGIFKTAQEAVEAYQKEKEKQCSGQL